jgi:hypothetical protein
MTLHNSRFSPSQIIYEMASLPNITSFEPNGTIPILSVEYDEKLLPAECLESCDYSFYMHNRIIPNVVESFYQNRNEHLSLEKIAENCKKYNTKVCLYLYHFVLFNQKEQFQYVLDNFFTAEDFFFTQFRKVLQLILQFRRVELFQLLSQCVSNKVRFEPKHYLCSVIDQFTMGTEGLIRYGTSRIEKSSTKARKALSDSCFMGALEENANLPHNLTSFSHGERFFAIAVLHSWFCPPHNHLYFSGPFELGLLFPLLKLCDKYHLFQPIVVQKLYETTIRSFPLLTSFWIAILEKHYNVTRAKWLFSAYQQKCFDLYDEWELKNKKEPQVLDQMRADFLQHFNLTFPRNIKVESAFIYFILQRKSCYHDLSFWPFTDDLIAAFPRLYAIYVHCFQEESIRIAIRDTLVKLINAKPMHTLTLNRYLSALRCIYSDVGETNETSQQDWTIVGFKHQLIKLINKNGFLLPELWHFAILNQIWNITNCLNRQCHCTLPEACFRHVNQNLLRILMPPEHDGFDGFSWLSERFSVATHALNILICEFPSTLAQLITEYYWEMNGLFDFEKLRNEIVLFVKSQPLLRDI